MPSTRRKLIVALRIQGALAADEASRALGMTPGAARQHLLALRVAGLVTVRELRSGPGRPRHLFSLTPAAESLFPSISGRFVNNLLAAASHGDSEEAARIIRRAVSDQLDLPLVPGASLAERLAAVQAALEAEGFFPVMRTVREGQVELGLYNCPFFESARDNSAFCESEAAEIGRLCGDAVVERVESRRAGQHACKYVVTVASGAKPELP